LIGFRLRNIVGVSVVFSNKEDFGGSMLTCGGKVAAFCAVSFLALTALGAAQSDRSAKSDQGKLSSELHRLAVAAERGGRLSARDSTWVDEAAQLVTAVIVLTEGAKPADIEPVVKASGGSVEAASSGLVKIKLPARALREVSSHPSVLRMRAPYKPSRKVTSEGVDTIRAPAYRDRRGVEGAGVTVGILDTGFRGATALIGTELPEETYGTDYVREHANDFTEEHGTACAEIIHDVAPGAALLLASFEDEVTWGAAVDELADMGVRIVSHSVGFDNLFPPNGDHFFAHKVDEVTNRGVLFVTAAGNEADRYYQGTWRDGNANDYLDYMSGIEIMPILVSGGATIALRWNDPFGRSNHDYDLFVVTEAFLENPDISPFNPAIIAASTDLQSGSEDPVESVSFQAEGVVFVLVRHDPASPLLTSQRFWVWSSVGVDPEFATAAGTLTLPGDARGAFTVGAVEFASLGLEGFSSRGPTADNRVKPDVVGPDGVSTAAYGSPFFGSSAATPHVAGAAALILSANPSMNVDRLKRALEEAVNDLGRGRRKNNETGFGLIDLSRAR
jgi:subtilisin family serine protease